MEEMLDINEEEVYEKIKNIARQKLEKNGYIKVSKCCGIIEIIIYYINKLFF